MILHRHLPLTIVGVAGDLHMDPRKMEDYVSGRQDWLNIFHKAKLASSSRSSRTEHAEAQQVVVSLGDLGESKAVYQDSLELFSGTTECHQLAAEYLSSMGVPYEVVTGNHDLEGIDEFATDEENLAMFLDVHGKPTPQFKRQIADKTLLVGLSSTVFREARYTSHEVSIDQAQIDWFEQVLESHPAEEGWKIFVFTHAPPNGSGLRVLQENHVVNGCCWLNHSNDVQCRKFIELARKHNCVKAWFSGHFHLGQDYQDSITFPTKEHNDGVDPNRGSCVFVQTSVMRAGSSRDERRQSRLLRGNQDGFEICTVDHTDGGKVRVDAAITYTEDNKDCKSESICVKTFPPGDADPQSPEFRKVYNPREGDGLEVVYEREMTLDEDITQDTKAWWRLANGRVLGLVKGMLLEYDQSTLAPLGLVVGRDEMVGKRLAVIDTQRCEMSIDVACEEDHVTEQAVVVFDPKDGNVVVVQPNEDGSYWRKIVRNKMVRMEEKRREMAAKAFAESAFASTDDVELVSTWGPCTTTEGNAKNVVTVPDATNSALLIEEEVELITTTTSVGPPATAVNMPNMTTVPAL